MNFYEYNGVHRFVGRITIKSQFSKEWKNAEDTLNSQKKLEIRDFFKHFNLSPFFGRGLSFKGKKWL